MTLITYQWSENGAPADPQSIVWSDAGATFGIRRTDNNAVLVAAGTEPTRIGVGLFQQFIDDQAPDLVYETWLTIVPSGGNPTYPIRRHKSYNGVASLSAATQHLRFVIVKEGALIAADEAPKLASPSGVYGIVRTDTGETVVPSGEEFDDTGGFVYGYDFDGPAPNLAYRYYVAATVGGVLYSLPRNTGYVKSVALVFGRYCHSQMIELQYGVDNVQKWLGIDDTDEAVDYAMRLYDFIAAVESEIDDTLRGGPVTVPMDAPVPSVVARIATALAGVRIYESRGVVDMDPETGRPQHRLQYQAKWVDQQLARIKAGQIRLATDDVQRFPAVGGESHRRHHHHRGRHDHC